MDDTRGTYMQEKASNAKAGWKQQKLEKIRKDSSLEPQRDRVSAGSLDFSRPEL